MPKTHHEKHRSQHTGWLRAAVLGANDGIVSTASLIIGIAATNVDNHTILVTGTAGLVAGAMSMAAGEYVSVSSQADTENADLERERRELENNHLHEVHELKSIYMDRGLDPNLAQQVAEQLMAHDALGAHARDELGISDIFSARPIQAAFTSAFTFSIGAALPLLMVIVYPFLQMEQFSLFMSNLTTLEAAPLISTVGTMSIISLVLLGGLSAYTGGSSIVIAITRITFWGVLAMIVTAGVGMLFGAVG
ncbi:hypothetical protein AU255_09880 [Methyloprofundus sedimenti]|uniref:Nodulin 21 n=1 Tax=Methyloprofundus sedimenti TaxID=1420851 RepID=A0A1V8M9D5_9GAMM|nr:VIT family protein [Methyloprofundus sedimenti]OQK18126.1 hypothetical protein AU255_09880 [Methyloprofundus sedimenti]